THDDRPVVILEGAGKNFAGRCTALIDEHDHRSFVKRRSVVRVLHLHLPDRVLHLHHGTTIDEETCHAANFFKRTSAIVAEIEDESVDLLLIEPYQKMLHIS